jgi:hypothetical protein
MGKNKNYSVKLRIGGKECWYPVGDIIQLTGDIKVEDVGGDFKSRGSMTLVTDIEIIDVKVFQ